jgi:small subunit ribosomal protein S1
MTASFAELFEQSLAENQMQPGAIVKGTVVEIRPDAVVVNAGLKSEGLIPIEQFYTDEGVLEVKEGDEIEVALDAVEDGFGETRLSREKAKRARVWEKLEEAFENEEIVTGLISGKVKGGFTVDIGEIRAFLPGSLVDVRPVRDAGYLEGKELEFKVIKLDRRRNNVVVSRRAVVESEYCAEREALLENLQEGQVVKGVSKTSPIMAPSSIWGASMVCCISPKWPGSESSIPLKWSMSAMKSRSRSLKLTVSAIGSHWV